MNDDQTAFATRRFLADDLDPAVVTGAVGHEPTLSYRKGETYQQGRRKREIVGRTGLWLISTNDLFERSRLDDHVSLLTSIIAPRADDITRMLDRYGYKVDASCFWAGSAGAPKPDVPLSFRDLIAALGGDLELDFSRDEPPGRMAAE